MRLPDGYGFGRSRLGWSGLALSDFLSRNAAAAAQHSYKIKFSCRVAVATEDMFNCSGDYLSCIASYNNSLLKFWRMR